MKTTYENGKVNESIFDTLPDVVQDMAAYILEYYECAGFSGITLEHLGLTTEESVIKAFNENREMLEDTFGEDLSDLKI